MKLFTSDVRALSPEAVGKHDVLVCELMDASGVGESLLGVLDHDDAVDSTLTYENLALTPTELPAMLARVVTK